MAGRFLLIKAVLVLTCLLMAISTPISAKAENTFVLGFSLGDFNFEDEDFNDIDGLLYGTEFLEWYPSESWGLAIKTHKFYKNESSNEDTELLMYNAHLSVIWIFMGPGSDLQAGVYAGYGPGNVTYKNKTEDLDIEASTNTSSGGLFIDWGGETFGLRFGIHTVSASFDYKDGDNSGTINGSGTSADIGVRVAF
ncbi:hypothetical protein KJ966_17875 [bacterium]|nr:hypothetical protein [bacterium]